MFNRLALLKLDRSSNPDLRMCATDPQLSRYFVFGIRFEPLRLDDRALGLRITAS
jgi:hypothetical protein